MTSLLILCTVIAAQSYDAIPVAQQIEGSADGTFELAGLPLGRHRLEATGRRGRSAMVDVELTAAEQAPIELVIRPDQQIGGRVVAGSAAVAGARITASPVNLPARAKDDATSDGSGRFTLMIPAGATELELTVIAAGFATTMFRTTVDSRTPLDIDVAGPAGTLVAVVPAESFPNLVHRGVRSGLLGLQPAVELISERDVHYQRLTVTGLRPGEYSVCVEQKCASAYVPPYGNAAVSIR